MAKRVIDTSFWTDDKVVEEFSPEDKLFFLYLMTNPHTTQLGIYHINKKVMAFEIGYSVDAIGVLLERFENKYKILKYSDETSEVAIRNYLKHSIVKGGKPIEEQLKREIKKVKDKTLIQYISDTLSATDTLNESVKKILPFINNANANAYANAYAVSQGDSSTVQASVHNGVRNSVRTKELEQEFDELWELYPRKQGKTNALKSYIKARKEGVTKEEVKQGILDYGAYIKTNNVEGKYIKMGSTWFNQRCWTDDLSMRVKSGRLDWIDEVEL